MDESVVQSGFFKCPNCSKLHQFHGITVTSLCSCGASLWEAIRNK